MLNNPFSPLKDKPKATETDYHTEQDDFIITYDVVQKVKITGEKDTDFVIKEEVVEVDRTNRQDYYNSMADEVGILNIIEKVRLSGDATLLNQTGRVAILSDEKDALGRNVEKIVDVSKYQVDQIEALEQYKKGAASFESLDPELKKKLSFKEIANMSDSDIDAFLKARYDAAKIAAEKKAAEKGE